MSNKGGLGRGLGALITGASQESGSEDLRELPLDMITPNPEQPRTELDEEALQELADSIGKVGLLQPILVRPYGDGYQIVAGERRWRASRIAGLDRIPVRIKNMNDEDTLISALIENLQREDLNAIEEARGYRRLLQSSQMTQAEMADRVSKSRSAITNALRLLELPEEVQEMVYDARISAGHGRAILSVPDTNHRVRLAEKVLADGLSVRETESLSRLYAAGQIPVKHREPTPKSFKAVARHLRKLLGTAVKVRQNEKKGKIEIEFHGEDDLNRLFALLSGTAARNEGSDE